MNRVKICVSGLLTVIAVACVALPSTAVACHIEEETVTWTYPAEGEKVPPDVQLLVVVSGVKMPHVTRLLNVDGEEVGLSEESENMPAFTQAVTIMAPDEALAAGEYRLKREYPAWPNNNFEMTFHVDENLGTASKSGPVEMKWYQRTFEKPFVGPCNSYQESQSVRMQPLDEPPAYYEIVLDGQFSERVQFVAAEDVDGRPRSYTARGVECIRVAGIAPDGTRGTVVESCEPKKCEHITDVDAYEPTGWDHVEGCGDGEPAGGSDQSEEAENSTPDGSQAECATMESHRLEERSKSSSDSEGLLDGCASTRGGVPVPLVLALAILVGLHCRRPRHGEVPRPDFP